MKLDRNTVEGFQKPKRRRLNKPQDELSYSITPLNDKAMVLDFKHTKVHLYRLKYKGVPNLIVKTGTHLTEAQWILPESIINLQRDTFVKQMFDVFSGKDTNKATGGMHFQSLVRYVRWFDSSGGKVSFSEVDLKQYNTYLGTQYLSGKLSKTMVHMAKTGLRSILADLSLSHLAKRCFSEVKGRRSIPTQALDHEIYIPLFKKMIKAYHEYAIHYQHGTKPEYDPLYDKDELSVLGFSKVKIGKILTGARLAIHHSESIFENRLTALAMVIYCGFTGSNIQPARELKRSDISFNKGAGDNYSLKTIKSRAKYQKQYQQIGFTKRSKEFVESWLTISQKIAPSIDGPLFPFLEGSGEVNFNSRSANEPQKKFNKILERHGYPKITSQILRVTRSDLIQRAYDDIQLTADANNNSVLTTAKCYLDGVKAHNHLQIGSAFDVQYQMVMGNDKEEAINNNLYKISDPFQSDEWLAKKEAALSVQTPTGFRCTEPFGDRAKRSVKQLGDLESAKDTACIDYLDCFECSHHALVAEFDDIWLTLSFKDSVKETLARPSYNSSPSKKLNKILNTLDNILDKYKTIAPDIYEQAVNKNNEEPHPMYDSEFDSQAFVGAQL